MVKRPGAASSTSASQFAAAGWRPKLAAQPGQDNDGPVGFAARPALLAASASVSFALRNFHLAVDEIRPSISPVNSGIGRTLMYRVALTNSDSAAALASSGTWKTPEKS